MRIAKYIILLAALACGSSCQKIKYYPDKDYREVTTKVLAHRAGGGDHSPYQENSLEAAQYGLSIVDGLEVDVQISKDRTVWLGHNADLPECGGTFYDCFPEETDDRIVALDSCDGDKHSFTRLEDIFSTMASSYPGSFISIDVKAWPPCAVTSSDVLGVMNVIGDEVIRLTNKYNLQNRVMVESETGSFLNYVKKNGTGVEYYLISFGDFERAMQLSLEAGLTGISFHYKWIEEISAEHIQLIRKKGLKIQLWTVNSEVDIEEALSINPDFIQTDNLDYFRRLP